MLSLDALTEPRVLREYALLADGERGALVGPLGEVTWLCFPGWDGEPLLSSLVGGGGVYAVTPQPRSVWGGYYEEGTLVWRSRWATAATIVECREALAFPGDPGHAVLVRRVEAIEGDTPMRAVLRLCDRAGAGRPRPLRRHDDGTWTGRVGDAWVRWSGAAATARSAGHGTLVLDLCARAGERHDLVLEIARDRLVEPPPEAHAVWSATVEAWQRAVPPLDGIVARRDARHAAAVLRGLTTAPGAMVAAATTSLPERAEAGRNFDYRFAWVRDQCYAGQAVAACGGHPLLDDQVRFVTERVLADGPGLRPAYRPDGTAVPSESPLPLGGYPGAPRVVAGNQAGSQFQLDVFGEVLLLLAAAARCGRLGEDGRRAAEVAAAALEQRHRQPDCGVWELDPRRWTHSRLVCAAGLRAIAGQTPRGPLVNRWLALADSLVAGAARDGLHRTGRWRRAPDDDRVDAALLLAQVRGAVDAADPRSRATLDAVRTELERDGYVYRFQPDTRPLGEAEGAFLLCGFWLALACAQADDATGMERWFERSRAACGPPGLYTEEFDVVQRQLRGNLPQAFVHALMLECAATLSAR